MNIIEKTDTHFIIETDDHVYHQIPFQAVASWGELLGYDNSRDTIAAILHVKKNGEPKPDADGNNVWTKLYDAIVPAQSEPGEVKTGSRSKRSVTNTTTPRQSAQEEARSILGLSEPSTPTVTARMQRSVDVEQPIIGGKEIPKDDPIGEILEGKEELIMDLRQQFLNSLSPGGETENAE